MENYDHWHAGRCNSGHSRDGGISRMKIAMLYRRGSGISLRKTCGNSEVPCSILPRHFMGPVPAGCETVSANGISESPKKVPKKVSLSCHWLGPSSPRRVSTNHVCIKCCIKRRLVSYKRRQELLICLCNALWLEQNSKGDH